MKKKNTAHAVQAKDFVGVNCRQNESGVLRGGKFFLGLFLTEVVGLTVITNHFLWLCSKWTRPHLVDGIKPIHKNGEIYKKNTTVCRMRQEGFGKFIEVNHEKYDTSCEHRKNWFGIGLYSCSGNGHRQVCWWQSDNDFCVKASLRLYWPYLFDQNRNPPTQRSDGFCRMNQRQNRSVCCGAVNSFMQIFSPSFLPWSNLCNPVQRSNMKWIVHVESPLQAVISSLSIVEVQQGHSRQWTKLNRAKLCWEQTQSEGKPQQLLCFAASKPYENGRYPSSRSSRSCSVVFGVISVMRAKHPIEPTFG